MKKAIITFTIGEKYANFWQQFCKNNWEIYAKRYGYDIIRLENFLDLSPKGRGRSPHWQKLLILEHPEVQKYDRVVWMDSDIIINFHHAPCIIDSHTSDRIGVISLKNYYAETGRADNNLHRYWRYLSASLTRGMPRHPGIPELYRWANLPATDQDDDITNTGVIVLSPRLHGKIFREIYETYQEVVPFSVYEQVPLSFHLFRNHLVDPLDYRFNAAWEGEIVEHYPFLLSDEGKNNRLLRMYCVNTSWHNHFFLHFTTSGTRDDVQLLWQAIPTANFVSFRENGKGGIEAQYPRP